MNRNLNKRAALVTGGSRGIGAAICRKLAEDTMARHEAAFVAVCAARESDELSEVVERLRNLGATALPLTGNLGDPDVPGRLVAQAVDAFGGLDAVVSNAGIASPASLAELDIAGWDRMFDVNSRASWLLAKAAYPALKQSRGAFVAVASMSGIQPHPGSGAYSPAKAAVTMLCRTLAQEWAKDGIRVNTVSPGMIHTPMTAPIYTDKEVAARRVELVPLGRIGEPADVARAVAFLAGSDADYITGQNLCVDGGFSGSILNHIPGVARS